MTNEEICGLISMAKKLAENVGVDLRDGSYVRILHDEACPVLAHGIPGKILGAPEKVLEKLQTRCACFPEIELDAKDEMGDDCILFVKSDGFGFNVGLMREGPAPVH